MCELVSASRFQVAVPLANQSPLLTMSATTHSLAAMAISFMDIGGGKLAVEVEGHGPLVICSPGLGDTRDAFAPLAGHLVARGYRVACIDLRGHGDSSAHFDRYGDEAIAEDLLAVIEALGGGPAILAGASVSQGLSLSDPSSATVWGG